MAVLAPWKPPAITPEKQAAIDHILKLMREGGPSAPGTSPATRCTSVIVSFHSKILICAIDSRDGERHEIAAAVLGHAIASGMALLPLQALAEFYRLTTRKYGIDRPTARAFVEGWRHTARVEPYGEADIEAAMNACEAHGLSFWDAMIWAVSERVGASLLVTEDMQPGRRLGNVTLVNPFDPASRPLLGFA